MQLTVRRLVISAAALSALTLASPRALAQIDGLPRLSQRAGTTQVVGIAEVEVIYHRPGVKGRVVWGDLVPYGHVWRAGANENTVLVLSHPATVEGTLVAAGRYGLHMIPGEQTWTVMLSKDSNAWGSFSYDVGLDAARAEVKPEKAAFKEWMQYEFTPHSDDALTLALRWDELRVPIHIEFDTHGLALVKLREAVTGKRADKWQTFHNAANYCLDAGIYTEEALGWIDHAIEGKPLFANLAIRAGLLEGLERFDEAQETLDRALRVGNANEVGAYGSQLKERGEFDRAVQFLEVALEKAPTLWWAWANLGEAFAGLGLEEPAVESYDKALEFASSADDKAFVRSLRDKLERKS
ncbi:MAG: tetratricopeptide (TPR) repeat protein [Chlamydiales bacterium]|jgi:tetratricopeptide (TPR) repeat protein